MTRVANGRARPQTREQIIDAAARVLQTLGLGRATTKEIAQAAGLSEAALYKHFHDKSDLFLCVLKERFPELFQRLHELPLRVGRRTVRANLEELARVAIRFYEESAPVAAAMFAEPELLARHQAQMRARGVGPDRAVNVLAEYLRAEQRIGRVAGGVDVQAAAALLIGACLGRAFLRQFNGAACGVEDDEVFVKGVVRTLLDGLQPRTPRRPRPEAAG